MNSGKLSAIQIAKQKSMRYRVFDELLYTQKNYHKDLIIILDDIRGKLLEKKIINSQQNNVLFLYVEQMKQLSFQFGKRLQQIQDTWNQQTTMVGEKILYFSQYFKIYRDYCSQYENKLKIIEKIRKNPESQSIQKKLQLQQYESYMVKPIQRPVKYHLLLQQYLKATPQNHPDIPHIKQAILKYQQVNTENNKFLGQLQSLKKTMELQKKFSLFNDRIIPQYIAEYKCLIYPSTKCVAYILQDQVVVVNQKNWIRFQLTSDSFAEPCIDGKSFQNRCYLGGKKMSIHLDFQTQQNMKAFCKIIKEVIFNIFNKELDKKMCQSNKLGVSQKQKANSIFYSPKVRITIYSVDINSQTLTLKISVPYPNKMFQFITLLFEEVYQLYFFLIGNHSFSFILSKFPQFDTTKKYTNTVMDPKLLIIQRFLHFIFRDQQILLKSREKLRQIIDIEPQLQNFLTSQTYECQCEKCLNFDEGENFLTLKKHLKENINSNSQLLNHLQKTQQFQVGPSYAKINDKKCVFYSFNFEKCINLLPSEQFKTIQDKMIFLQYYLGRIDYNLIQRPLRPFKIDIFIFLPQIMAEPLKIYVNQFTTIFEVRQIVRIKLKLKSLRDYTFTLENDKNKIILHGDQKAFKLRQILEYKKKQVKSQPIIFSQSIFEKRFSQFKKSVKNSVKQLILGKKYKLCLHKFIHFQKDLQLNEFQTDKNRLEMIADQIIYLMKTQSSQTSLQETTNLISLAYCVQKKKNKQKIQQVSMSDALNIISKPYMNSYLQSCEYKLQCGVKQFGAKIIKNIQRYRQWQIIKLYRQIVNEGYKSQIWGKYYFQIQKYQKELNKQFFSQQVLIGLNHKYLQIINKKCLKKIWITIDMKKLKYKIDLNSIFIQIENKYRQFDCQMIGSLKYALDYYKALNKKF